MFTREMMIDYADKLLIGLSDEEIEILLSEFDAINENMELIDKIPGIEKVEPMTHTLDDFVYEKVEPQSFPTDYTISSLREDKAEESLPIEDILRNCDGQIDRMVEVPKVVG